MTFDEAAKGKIDKIRLPWFLAGAYVDPRVIEYTKGGLWSPIIDTIDPPKNSAGEIAFGKIMLDESTSIWEEYYAKD